MSPSSIQTLAKRSIVSTDCSPAEIPARASPLAKLEFCSLTTTKYATCQTKWLSTGQYETASVSDGSAALDTLSDNHFDLILLDINMPGMDGVEVMSKTAANSTSQDHTVIFVTLHGDFQTHAQSLLSGGDDLISKPISPLELIVKSTVFLLSTQGPRSRRDKCLSKNLVTVRSERCTVGLRQIRR